MNTKDTNYSRLESQKEDANNKKFDSLSQKIKQFRNINSDILDQSERDLNSETGILGQLEERLNSLNSEILQQSRVFARILAQGGNRKLLRNVIIIVVSLIILYYILKYIF
ncbi:hypothetical protein HANVADRAFT_47001 [Hanseniaspora valbyensis NRRL Y-1626]|uniref:t-SNARE coiled-coil homology domain-containing protein n=1 Tax=Hanseniaspora valbyensis NRRL Y-1626 TaxID=766949 RepID=A0A1B7TJ81_9ASCO|nr:hypothetical protein HANVADRAFT_47001 [Hanseniaspora valbyensis NRRL Y-1626]